MLKKETKRLVGHLKNEIDLWKIHDNARKIAMITAEIKLLDAQERLYYRVMRYPSFVLDAIPSRYVTSLMNNLLLIIKLLVTRMNQAANR